VAAVEPEDADEAHGAAQRGVGRRPIGPRDELANLLGRLLALDRDIEGDLVEAEVRVALLLGMDTITAWYSAAL
jgi:hypothetical protein